MKLPLKTVFLDIEVNPLLAYVWRTGKTVITIDSLLPDSMVKIICISWRWGGSKKTYNLHWDEAQNDKQLLIDFLEAIKDAECVVGHNGKSFDLKIINARIAYHQLDNQVPLMMIEDTLLMFRKVMNLPSMKLDYLLHYFGIKRKIHTDMSWWMRTCYMNDRMALAKMCKYCNRDVDAMYDLYEKLYAYLPTKQSYAIVNNNNRMCPGCGKESLISNGYRHTALGKKQRMRCSSCGKTCTLGINEVKHASEYPRGE